MAATTLAVALTSLAAPAGAGGGTTVDRSAKPVTVAVIGDVPYGTAQEATFGDLIGAVNDDPKVRAVIHVGDIKSGSTTCTDERFAAVEAAFKTFEDPLVYTPGDNEWTDCHRANNGAYNPLERLAAVRARFFAEPGTTLGRRSRRVDSQSALAENVRWVESRVAFATVHVIGSDNGLAPWTGLGLTAPTPAQGAEVAARVAAGVDWIDETFDEAEEGGLDGVVLGMQADTWAPAPSGAQQAIVERIAARSAAFDGQVLILQGDSHVFTADHPLALDNVTRIVVHGEMLPFEYLRLTIDHRQPELFSWERVPVVR
ncbi:MAG: metallophosphoesterase [Acidimicrobiales bacterium]